MLKYISTFLVFISLNTYGFGVDICFNKANAKEPLIKNCLNLGEECRTSHLSHKQALSCRLKALYTGVSGLATKNKIAGARSLLHSDATYFMAQLIGFDAWQAYQMMIYSEATDQTQYTAFNQKGLQILTDAESKKCRDNWHDAARKCLLITPEVKGVSKFSFQTGGMLLHLHARFSADGKSLPIPSFPTDYFSPTNQPYENLLTNFRAWVFNERHDACAAGITQIMSLPDAIHSPCQQSQYTLRSPMSFFSLGLAKLTIPFVTQLGTLIIEKPESNSTSTPVLANNKSFQTYITPHEVAFAKMGIFVHALADRYSHHMCIDSSYFYQKSNDNYTSIYSSLYCGQGSHFLWHVWEQGTNQTNHNLGIEHQTMKPALEAVYDQLLAYAQYKNIAINPTLDKQAIIDDLILVLQTFDPLERLQKMVALMEKNKLLPLPGHGSTADDSVDKWLTLAGAPNKQK
ncbi:MAG: hypothetical protein K0U37_07220 [Gammaproteobacteria bacterium]|nr:hypothetical protein [Gammaproteobacteria bacterium]